MFRYYHNTTENNPENITLGYISEYGDFLTKQDLKQINAIAVIIVEGGLLSAGESYDDYCKRVGREGYKKMISILSNVRKIANNNQ